MTRRIQPHASLFVLTATVLCAAVAAQAQDIVPPTPGDIAPASPLPAYALGILLAGGAIALSAIPSKRTHED